MQAIKGDKDDKSIKPWFGKNRCVPLVDAIRAVKCRSLRKTKGGNNDASQSGVKANKDHKNDDV